MGKCFHVILNIGNYMGNVPMLFITLGITWGNISIYSTRWELHGGNVSMSFTRLGITWEMFPCCSQLWELHGEMLPCYSHDCELHGNVSI